MYPMEETNVCVNKRMRERQTKKWNKTQKIANNSTPKNDVALSAGFQMNQGANRFKVINFSEVIPLNWEGIQK